MNWGGQKESMKNDLISREALRTALVQAFGCENATKYGNKNAEQQANSYSTYMLYEIADTIEDVIDNAPSVEEITNEDIQQAIKEGFANGYEMAKEKIIHSIKEQYSAHNKLVPIWLSIGDIK